MTLSIGLFGLAAVCASYGARLDHVARLLISGSVGFLWPTQQPHESGPVRQADWELRPAPDTLAQAIVINKDFQVVSREREFFFFLFLWTRLRAWRTKANYRFQQCRSSSLTLTLTKAKKEQVEVCVEGKCTTSGYRA